MEENVCIRCGKVRIFFKRWKEKTDGRGSVIIREEYVCPDKECQKIVNEKFEEMRLKRIGMEERRNGIKIGTPKQA